MTGPDVVGPAEARALIGNPSRRWFATLAGREDFPPARELEIGRVWDRAEIAAWAKDRTPGGGHGRAVHLEVLRAYRRTGNITAAARAGAVARTTARRWLEALDVLEP